MRKDNVKIEGIQGKWYLLGEKEWKNKKVYLWENEKFGDECPHVITDENLKVVVADSWNGFEDLNDLEEENTTIQEKHNMQKQALEEIKKGIKLIEGLKTEKETLEQALKELKAHHKERISLPIALFRPSELIKMIEDREKTLENLEQGVYRYIKD